MLYDCLCMILLSVSFSASTVDADQMIDCVQNIYAPCIIFLSYLLKNMYLGIIISLHFLRNVTKSCGYCIMYFNLFPFFIPFKRQCPFWVQGCSEFWVRVRQWRGLFYGILQHPIHGSSWYFGQPHSPVASQRQTLNQVLWTTQPWTGLEIRL